MDKICKCKPEDVFYPGAILYSNDGKKLSCPKCGMKVTDKKMRKGISKLNRALSKK